MCGDGVGCGDGFEFGFCCLNRVALGNTHTGIGVLGTSLRLNNCSVDQYSDIFTQPLLDDTHHFDVQTCLILGVSTCFGVGCASAEGETRMQGSMANSTRMSS